MLNSREIDALRADVAANCRAWLARCQAAGLPGRARGTQPGGSGSSPVPAAARATAEASPGPSPPAPDAGAGADS